MHNLDLNLLRIFDALERHHHVGRAAEELHLSQPSVSYALRRLRQQLGDPLFVKGRNGVTPTQRSIELAPIIRSILNEVRDRVLVSPKSNPSETRRTFTLAMTDLGQVVFLPKILTRMKKIAPKATFRVVSTEPYLLMRALEKSEVDLALGYYPDLKGSDVIQQRLFTHGFTCIMRAGHPALKGRMTKKKFLSLQHAAIEGGTRSHEIIERFFKRQRTQRNIVLRLPHYLSIPLIVASTDLVVTVPTRVAEEFTKLRDIRMVSSPFVFPTYDLSQYWHLGQHNDHSCRWLREQVFDLIGRGKEP